MPTHSRFCIPGATYPAGATLTIAAWNASRGGVTIANVGDSAALLVDAAGSRLLTEEHRLSDSAAERERVRCEHRRPLKPRPAGAPPVHAAATERARVLGVLGEW